MECRYLNTFVFKVMFCIIMTCLVFLILSYSISAGTVYVDDNGGGDYTKIQDAINNANQSDIIYVYSGTYNENIIINKTVVLSGENRANTLINGVSSSKHTVEIIVNGVDISGFTIKNNAGLSMHYACIFLNAVSSCIVSNNIVKNGENGIYLSSSTSSSINGNTIENNNANGLHLSGSSENTIIGNTIQNNERIGIYFSASCSSNIVTQNSISGNNLYGIRLVSSIENIFHHNIFSDNNINVNDPNTNSWDDGGEGNFWDDYTGQDSNEDGIGDTPYEISGGSNQDRYPLGYFVSQNQKPLAFVNSISPSPSIHRQIVYFDGQVIDDGTIIQWEWTSSIDGGLSNSEDFSTSTLSVGSHSIKFRAKDDQDKWSEYATSNLVVNPISNPQNQKPTAQIIAINPNKANFSSTVYFHGIGSDDGYVNAYQWRSSIDGILSNQQTFTSIDLSAGTHIVYFKVRDNEGEWSNEDKKSLIIVKSSEPSNSAPIPNSGGPYSEVVNVSIVFDASGSYDLDGDIFSCSWDFGDGSTGEGMTENHLYSQIGNYTVTLTLTDSNNKTSYISTFANISKNPNEYENADLPSNEIPGFTFFIALISIIIFLNRKK
ncbi:MAG: right-handed parallel beta-helix repeat-containing protein [Candidatus Thermoplasmatota archaeon]|nr:right-handed parallel beta-helix repeat-containing protein [Candidatus Thermoplasmatota archaeon]